MAINKNFVEEMQHCLSVTKSNELTEVNVSHKRELLPSMSSIGILVNWIRFKSIPFNSRVIVNKYYYIKKGLVGHRKPTTIAAKFKIKTPTTKTNK